MKTYLSDDCAELKAVEAADWPRTLLRRPLLLCPSKLDVVAEWVLGVSLHFISIREQHEQHAADMSAQLLPVLTVPAHSLPPQHHAALKLLFLTSSSAAELGCFAGAEGCMMLQPAPPLCSPVDRCTQR